MQKNLKVFPVVLLLAILLVSLWAVTSPPEVQALPEYSSQTGEPCATCHISPSGGGGRSPRGQAWVGEGKPGTVPGLVAALEALGVHLDVDESAYQVVPDEISPAEPLPVTPAQVDDLHNWVSARDGN